MGGMVRSCQYFKIKWQSIYYGFLIYIQTVADKSFVHPNIEIKTEQQQQQTMERIIVEAVNQPNIGTLVQGRMQNCNNKLLMYKYRKYIFSTRKWHKHILAFALLPLEQVLLLLLLYFCILAIHNKKERKKRQHSGNFN